MGTDFSHCEAHWSYSGFHRFRTRLASAANIELEAMEGFEPLDGQEAPGRSWDTVHDDLALFLDHSDCDGDLSPEDCLKIADRIEPIIKTWPDDDYDKKNAVELIEGLRWAAENKETFRFQ